MALVGGRGTLSGGSGCGYLGVNPYAECLAMSAKRAYDLEAGTPGPTRVYEEVVNFIAAGPSSRQVAEFRASEEARGRVADLIHREKTGGPLRRGNG